MHAAVRSPLTAGVALVGAGAIAVSPLVVPAHDIDLAVPRITSAAVDLMANPLAIYGQAIGDALTSAGVLVPRFTDIVGPTLSPAFLEFLAGVAEENATALVEFLNPENLIDYANGLPATFQDYSDALQPFLQTLIDNLETQVPVALETAFDQLGQGDFEGAVNTLLNIPIAAIGLDILGPLVATETFLNALLPLPIVAAVTDAALGGPMNSGVNGAALLLGALGPLINLGGAFGTGVQGVIDAVEAGDPGGVVNAMVAIPGTILDGVLNGGYGPSILGLIPFPGLLTPTGLLDPIGQGVIAGVLRIADTFLTNLGWVPPAEEEPLTEVTSVPSGGAATFALKVGDTGSGATDDSLGAAAVSSGGSTGEEGAPVTGTAAEDENGSTGEENAGEDNAGEENASEENAADEVGADSGRSDAGEQGGSNASEQDGAGNGEQGGTGSDDGSASGDDDSTDTSMKDGNMSEPGDIGGGPADSNDKDSGPAADKTDGGSTGAGDATGGDNAAGGGSEGAGSDS